MDKEPRYQRILGIDMREAIVALSAAIFMTVISVWWAIEAEGAVNTILLILCAMFWGRHAYTYARGVHFLLFGSDEPPPGGITL